MSEQYQAERTISAVFKDQKQVNDVLQRLFDRGVPKFDEDENGVWSKAKTSV